MLVRSAEHGAVALGARGAHYLADGRVEGEDPLAPFSPNAPHHLLRTDGFAHVADIMVDSFYDPTLDEGCAFEELISFHGGLGGPQTRPFMLLPGEAPLPDEPIVGAAAVHGLLAGWRTVLQGEWPGFLERSRPSRCCSWRLRPRRPARPGRRRRPPGGAATQALNGDVVVLEPLDVDSLSRRTANCAGLQATASAAAAGRR